MSGELTPQETVERALALAARGGRLPATAS